MQYIPPSIRDIGILKHLDDTADKHNGYDGKDWDKMKLAGAGMASISRIFGIAYHTGRKYESIYFDDGHGSLEWRKEYTAKLKLKLKLKRERKVKPRLDIVD